MFKEKLNKLKNLITKKTEGDNKKNIENLVVFLILLIITVIAINSIWGQDKKSSDENNDELYKQLVNDPKITSTISENTEYNLEKRLEDILGQIAGVGKVSVMIAYSESSQVVPMYNEQHDYKSTE